MRGAWWMATIAGVLAFGSVAWGVRGHFHAQERMAPRMAAISALTVIGFLWWCWERAVAWQVPMRLPRGANLIGSVMTLGALALFWWAVSTTRARRLSLAFSNDIPTFVQSSGPYGWVRHPFYASYLLAWIGTALESPSAAYWVMPLGMSLLYVKAAEYEEAKFKHSPLAPEYERYRSSTGMLFPWPRRPWGR